MPPAKPHTPRPNIRKPLPCIHLGAATGETRPCKECTGTKDVPLRACELHGVCTETKLVTTATGKPVKCCSICPDRKPIDKPAPAAGRDKDRVLVPQPPAIKLTPKSSRAVVTFVNGKSGEDLHAISAPGQRAYAERLGADYVVLDWVGNPAWPMGGKFQIPRTLDHYERIVYVDADVVLRPAALDLFAACEPDEIGAYSDLPETLAQWPKFFEEFNWVRTITGLTQVPIEYYLNTGILVLSREQAPIFSTPQMAIPPRHCTEQHFWNARMLELGAKVRLLSKACNWQWWSDPGFKRNPPANAVLHFSGMTYHKNDRLMLMRKWAS